MDIQITFLGTSNAIPTAQRNHPSAWLEWGAERILIDCGEGTQRQCKKAGLNPCKLTKILLTHLHGDHVLGLPGLMETLGMSEYSRELDIYGPRGTSQHIEMLQRLYGKFSIRYKVHELPCTIENDEWEIKAEPMEHNVSTWAYAFIVKEKRRLDKKKIAKLKLPNGPIMAELQKGKDIQVNKKKIKAKDVTYIQPGKKVVFITDTKINQRAIIIAKDADLLVCEATYAEDEEEYALNYKHLTSKHAATIAKKAKVNKLVLNHIAQRYEQRLEQIEKEARKVFKNTNALKDLEQITV